jgi:hypothetical protein
MRKIASFLFAIMVMAAATLTASAQSEETRSVSGFTSIGSGGPFNVHIKIDGAESLKIVAKREIAAKIETSVDDGKLEIKWKDRFSWHNNDEDAGKIDIYITAKSLSGLANAGSGNMTVDGVISGGEVNIALSGSGSLSATVKADNLNASLSGSGSIRLGGHAGDAKISVSGSGTFSSKELETSLASISLAGSGSVYLTAEKSISGRIAGSGNIVYSGNASVDDIRTAGSGRMHKD